MSSKEKQKIKKNTESRTRSVRKSPALKKVVNKNPKKVTPKKSSTKKTTVKKVAAKKKVSSTNKNKPPVSKKTKETKEVVLPGNMSLRSVEKSAVLKREFDKYVNLSMYRIAYVSAFCFMAVGIALTANESLIPINSQMQLGQTSGTIDPNYSTGISTSSNTSTAIPDPVFTLISTVEDQYLQPDRITFSVTNIDNITANLKLTGGVGGFDLTPYMETLSNDKYRVNIPVTKLAPGYYKIYILIKPSNDTKFRLGYQTKEFHVGPYPTNTTSAATPTSTTSTTNTSTNTTDPTTTTTSTTNTSTTDTSGTATSTSLQQPAPTDPASTDPTIKNVPFALVLPGDNVISGTEYIFASVPDDYSEDIYLYARPANGTEPIFQKKFIKRELWVANVDSTNRISNGEYYFYAATTFKGVPVRTKAVKFSVFNETQTKVEDTNQTTEVVTAPVENDAQEGDFADVDPRIPNYYFNQDTEPINNDYLDEDVKREVKQILEDNKEEFDDLTERLSSAIASGDQSLIDAAQEELAEKRREIVTETLKDNRLQDISDNIDERLTAQIDNLQDRVETFEELRKERSGGTTAVDTDGDGISDYDERRLYGTDPENPDSDNDGFTDGIEIIKGFNPMSDEPEALIVFESPKESFGLERNDVLVVEEVIAIKDTESEVEEKSPIKQTQIRGRGLPNSFVTLYIFSTPTVVTIKTDSDGLFVYTFDKELEDGQHDVYVAMTDNAGEIIAQSNPFSFFKEAEAYTDIDSVDEKIITPETIVESSKSSYGSVVGIGILALGLILLMLGISLRSKKDDSDDGSDDDINGDTNEEISEDAAAEKPNTRFEHIDAT